MYSEGLIMEEYSSNIKKEPDDSYVWTCSIDPEYYRESLKPGLYACLGIAVFLLLFGGYLAYMYKNPMHFGIVVGCVAVYLLITALTFRLAFSADDPHETYKMSDIYVKNGYGKSSVYFDYDKAKTVIITGKYLELMGKVKKIRVYTPEGDFPFVSNYILNRLPGDCERRYEWDR